MRLDLDTYKEILDTITRNKSRSLLTGFGVFWGVFMLIALMGGGQGLKEILEKNVLSYLGFAEVQSASSKIEKLTWSAQASVPLSVPPPAGRHCSCPRECP